MDVVHLNYLNTKKLLKSRNWFVFSLFFLRNDFRLLAISAVHSINIGHLQNIMFYSYIITVFDKPYIQFHVPTGDDVVRLVVCVSFCLPHDNLPGNQSILSALK